MKTAALRALLLTGALLLLGSGVAAAQTQDFMFHWSPSPVIDGDGIVRLQVSRGAAGAVRLVATARPLGDDPREWTAICAARRHDGDVKARLQQAVDFTVRCQNSEGGWRYLPFDMFSDISVTVCQIMALRASRNVGIRVPRENIDRAVAYVLRSAVVEDIASTHGAHRGVGEGVDESLDPVGRGVGVDLGDGDPIGERLQHVRHTGDHHFVVVQWRPVGVFTIPGYANVQAQLQSLVADVLGRRRPEVADWGTD